MTLDMWIALLILGAAILLFITEWLRVDVVALGVVVALLLSGLLTTEEALAGFSNPAVLTIAALFVVGGAVMQTGLAGAIGERILIIAGKGPARLTAVVMLAVAAMSAFMSDTGTVAVLLPAISSLALSAGMSSSRLLIPLSYGSLLGGATTLIGTPPNLIVSDLLRTQGLEPFGFFAYTPIGLLLLAVGVLFMLLAGRRLLPDYRPKSDVQRVETPAELMDIYRLPADLFRLRVRRGSTLVGQSIDQARLRQDYTLTALKILRHTGLRVDDQAAQDDDLQTITPNAGTRIDSHDVLIVKGEAGDVAHAAAVLNLGVQPAQAEDESALISQEAGIAEVLLPPRSSLLGKSLSELKFGSQYHLTVLGIHRPGMDGSLDLKTTQLLFGDTLLVQGAWQNILALKKKRRDFVVMGEPEEMLAPPARTRAPLALLILLGMLVLIVTNLVPVAAASLLAALAMILAGCVSIDEAYEAVDWKSIVLIAGMLPMSTALEKVGLVSAQKLGVQPYALMMAVAIAASMAFATPVASPVNTLVMGAGHYRFIDYIKVGVPLILLALLASLLILPLLWPFS